MSEVMSAADVEALADQLDRWERGLDGANETDHWSYRLARALLTSGWLAARDAKVRAEGAAEALRAAADAVLSGEHRWQGGYFCECGHEVNSAAGWFAHVATARADAIQEGRADG